MEKRIFFHKWSKEIDITSGVANNEYSFYVKLFIKN